MRWNGVNFTTYLGLSDLGGWFGAPGSDVETAGVPGALGSLVGAALAAPDRLITVLGLLTPATLADRALAATRVETAFAGAGWLETDDKPGLRTRVVRVGRPVFEALPGAPKLVVPALRVLLTFRALDGGAEDATPAPPLLLGTTPVGIPTGTLPTAGMLLVWGSTSPLTITYSTANGARSTVLTLTGALATGEHYALDLGFAQAWHTTAAGVRTRFGGVTGAWPRLDPADRAGLIGADGLRAVLPTLALSSGTGLLVYRRRWAL